MMILITYDLKAPGKDYSGVHEAIKSAGWWWHHLESTWIIKSPNGPQYWYEKLAPYLDPNDSVFVCEIKNSYWGMLPTQAWEWLKDVFSKDK